VHSEEPITGEATGSTEKVDKNTRNITQAWDDRLQAVHSLLIKVTVEKITKAIPEASTEPLFAPGPGDSRYRSTINYAFKNGKIAFSESKVANPQSVDSTAKIYQRMQVAFNRNETRQVFHQDGVAMPMGFIYPGDKASTLSDCDLS
jgi:hypothetical protein